MHVASRHHTAAAPSRASRRKGLVERLHSLSCDDDLPQAARDLLAGMAEALASRDPAPGLDLLEGRESCAAFLRGWRSIRPAH